VLIRPSTCGTQGPGASCRSGTDWSLAHSMTDTDLAAQLLRLVGRQRVSRSEPANRSTPATRSPLLRLMRSIRRRGPLVWVPLVEKEDFLPEHALRALPISIAEARQRVRDRLGGVLEPEKLAEAELLTSELVTNAVRHAQVSDEATIEVAFEVGAGSVRVRVVDPGPGFDFEKILRTSPEEPGGWGLFLVEALTDRWGIDPPPPHSVWFEIDR
jgi:anti-sigma regulatory factor (Ser/Thr protein kinase)